VLLFWGLINILAKEKLKYRQMKFALVEDNKIEATKGAKGICPGCGSELIAKCGDVKLHHWAHKGNRDCDPWWENETEWHRSWKNNFAKDCQEVVLRDVQTNEKHIADVRTSHGLVIEFQHSKIETQERTSREHFYVNMVWVVDGTRLKGDFPRFLKGKILKTTTNGVCFVESPDKCFPSAWLESSVPVIFDFKGTEATDLNDMRKYLYCLFPVRMIERRRAILVTMSREYFIKSTTNGQWSLWVRSSMGNSQQKQQSQNANLQVKSNMLVRRTEPTHFLDPRSGRFVKRRRF
jgi:competence protein CoiA